MRSATLLRPWIVGLFGIAALIGGAASARERSGTDSSARIARAELDLVSSPATVRLEGSELCDDPRVTMGAVGGTFDTLWILSTSSTEILAELATTDPGTYVVKIDCCDTHRSDDDSMADGSSDGGSSSSDASSDDDSGEECLQVIDVTLDACDGCDLGPQKCPDKQCVTAIDSADQIVCGPCDQPWDPQACPPDECVIGLDDDHVLICGSCGNGGLGPQFCPPDQFVIGIDADDKIVCSTIEEGCDAGSEDRIGPWCIDVLAREPMDFEDATRMCHTDQRAICPVEAMILCDLLNDDTVSECATRTDDGATLLWTGTFEASFDPQAFQGLVVYGGDNIVRQADATETHRYFCCRPPHVPFERIRIVPNRAKRRQSSRGLTRESPSR